MAVLSGLFRDSVWLGLLGVQNSRMPGVRKNARMPGVFFFYIRQRITNKSDEACRPAAEDR